MIGFCRIKVNMHPSQDKDGKNSNPIRNPSDDDSSSTSTPTTASPMTMGFSLTNVVGSPSTLSVSTSNSATNSPVGH